MGNDDEPGIIPLAIEEVFAFIEEVRLFDHVVTWDADEALCRTMDRRTRFE